MKRRLALWLCPELGETIDETRLKAGNDAVERGARWETFYREEGGLLDMLESERRDLFEAMASLDPSDIGKVYWLATADRIVRRLQARVETIVITGKLEADKVQSIGRHLKRVNLDF